MGFVFNGVDLYMSLFTSVFWSVFTADSLAKGVQRPNFQTPNLYPLVESLDCSFKYLSLPYLCDPDHWLTHTEAQKVDYWLKFNSRRFEPCSLILSSDSDSNPSKNFGKKSPIDHKKRNQSRFIVGIALADYMKTMHSKTKRQIINCTARKDDQKELDLVFQQSLDYSADLIRQRWNQAKRSESCQFDAVVLITHQLTVCLQDQKIVNRNVFLSSLLVGLGYDKSLSKVFDAQRTSSDNDVIDTFKIAWIPKNDLSLQHRSRIDVITKIIANLDAFIDRRINTDISLTTSGKYAISPSQGIYHVLPPTWAIVVVAISLAITFTCVAISHWINVGHRGRNRFRQRDKASISKSHSSDRRWRAGFAGGVMDMHSSSNQTKDVTGSSNKKRGALFAAAKSRDKAQENYRRV